VFAFLQNLTLVVKHLNGIHRELLRQVLYVALCGAYAPGE
jgi:hypothetical protein